MRVSLNMEGTATMTQCSAGIPSLKASAGSRVGAVHSLINRFTIAITASLAGNRATNANIQGEICKRVSGLIGITALLTKYPQSAKDQLASTLKNIKSLKPFGKTIALPRLKSCRKRALPRPASQCPALSLPGITSAKMLSATSGSECPELRANCSI